MTGPVFALILTVLLAAVPRVCAAAAASVFLEELTSPELRDEIRSGKTTIIVPIGGTEQNGPHMVLGKHNVRVKVLSERIARALGNALVAPVLAYVPEGNIAPPTAHMRFPGTITITDETFVKILESAARGFRQHGFRDIVFLGDHGGYQKIDKSVAERLNREWSASPARVHAVDEYYRAADIDFAQALRRKGYRDAEIGTHAGLADTSLALAVDPRLVRVEQLQSANAAAAGEGVLGDPGRASAELGKLGVDAIVAQTTEAIRKAVARR
jgi:creatinine amidohydrolase/Fe(II)-dependent formamide hydrolase-like protein